MSEIHALHNRVKARRQDRGWSQADLAQRAGISRAAVSAIESQRLVPSVAAALALAAVFGCSVEELFGISSAKPATVEWAWPPPQEPCRYWQAEVVGRTLHFPVEATVAGVIGHDGIYQDGLFAEHRQAAAEETLVMACCDPAAGLLAAEYARSTGFRLLVLSRSSRQGLSLLRQGLVHVAGLHLATPNTPQANAQAMQDVLGDGYLLMPLAQWQEGLALAPGLAVRSVRSAVRSRLRWVGRELGSGARQCLDELRGNRPAPRRLARDHRGVAEAIRCGWADVGVCHRLVSEEAGLSFLPVREETYDLCYPAEREVDPRMQAFVEVLRSPSYRRLVAELPGCKVSALGES